MAQKYYKKTGNKTNKYIKKAKYIATKKEDKVQNKAIASLSKKVSQLIKQPELKWYDTNSSVTTVSSVGVWYNNISKNIVTGTTDNNRIGDQIRGYSLHVKGTLSINPSVPLSVVRIILVQYKQSYYTSAPDIGYLLADNVNAIRSYYDQEQKQHFNILYDKVYNLSVQAKPNVYLKINKTLGKRKIFWDSNIALNAPTEGQIFLYAVSDQTSFEPSLDVNTRLYFID